MGGRFFSHTDPKPGLPEYRVDRGEDLRAEQFPVDLAKLMGKKISSPN